MDHNQAIAHVHKQVPDLQRVAVLANELGEGFALNKVEVTGHGLNFFWRESAFGR